MQHAVEPVVGRNVPARPVAASFLSSIGRSRSSFHHSTIAASSCPAPNVPPTHHPLSGAPGRALHSSASRRVIEQRDPAARARQVRPRRERAEAEAERPQTRQQRHQARRRRGRSTPRSRTARQARAGTGRAPAAVRPPPRRLSWNEVVVDDLARARRTRRPSRSPSSTARTRPDRRSRAAGWASAAATIRSTPTPRPAAADTRDRSRPWPSAGGSRRSGSVRGGSPLASNTLHDKEPLSNQPPLETLLRRCYPPPRDRAPLPPERTPHHRSHRDPRRAHDVSDDGLHHLRAADGAERRRDGFRRRPRRDLPRQRPRARC